MILRLSDIPLVYLQKSQTTGPPIFCSLSQKLLAGLFVSTDQPEQNTCSLNLAKLVGHHAFPCPGHGSVLEFKQVLGD